MSEPVIKFNLKQLDDLTDDLKKSVKSVPIIVRNVLRLQLRALRREMAPLVPSKTGKLRRTLAFQVLLNKPAKGDVLGRFGFKSRGPAAGTVIAGNVLQHPGATAKKGAYLWIPTPSNKNITPKEFFAADNTFIAMGKGGNKIAYIRTGDADEVLPLFVLKHTVRFWQAPLPISERVEARLPEIGKDITDTIGQVIEAKNAVVRSVGG